MASIKTLQDVRDYLNSIPDINFGGCAISALAMYKWLEKNGELKKSTKIVYMYRRCSKDYYLNNKRYLNGLNENAGGCSHAVLKHKNEFLDCEKIIDKKEFQFRHIAKNIEFVVNSINNRDSWNDMFERDKYVKKIERKLGIKLEIEK